MGFVLGSSCEGLSASTCAAIDAVVDTALTKALLKENGPGRPQNLKENILNVKVRIYMCVYRVSKKVFIEFMAWRHIS